jgi:hypothetical protein
VSFKPEVIADTSGKWCGNALRFATREEAETNVRDRMTLWFAVREISVVEKRRSSELSLRRRPARKPHIGRSDAGAISFNPAGLRVWRGFCVLRSSSDPRSPLIDP